MPSNLERYKKDFDALLTKGQDLYLAIQAECFPGEIEEALNKDYGARAKEILEALPSFRET